MEDILEENRHYVDVIAIGEEDDYYLKLSNSKEYWNIPSKLADRLRGKHSSKTVASVSLGYDDEYSVKFSDGSRTSHMAGKTFWRDYDHVNQAAGVKHVAVGGHVLALFISCIFQTKWRRLNFFRNVKMIDPRENLLF